MKNKRILVFTLLMSALLVFSAMPAFSADDEVTFTEEFFTVASGTPNDSAPAAQADALTDEDVVTLADLAAAIADGKTVEKVYYKENIADASGLTDLLKNLMDAKSTIIKLEGSLPANSDFTNFKNTSAISFVVTDASNIIKIELPATIKEVKLPKAGIETLDFTNTPEVTMVVLSDAGSLKTLPGIGALKQLAQLVLSGAIRLEALILKDNTTATNLQLANLRAAKEGSVVLPDNAPLVSLDIAGGHFPFINAKKRFSTLKKFTGGDQDVSRSSVTGVGGKTFDLTTLFGSNVSGAADENKTVDYTAIASTVTATGVDEDGNSLNNLTGTVNDSNEVTWNNEAEPAKVTSITYTYNVDPEGELDGSMTVTAEDLAAPQTNNGVGGSGGGCSAGFGALALAAVAAFLLKKSR